MSAVITPILSDEGNSILNFSTSNKVEADIVENYLFFTDGVNEPRRINVTHDYSNFQPYDITVGKIAPQWAPFVSVESTQEGAGNYIEDKFVRFAYRYKYNDNTYSVYSPFSNIVFGLDTNVLTENQIVEAYSKGELSFLTNKAKTIKITPRSPSGPTGAWASVYGVVQVDILMKTSDSPAVYLLDSINVSTEVPPFIYNSEKPKAVLPEAQLTRVYDNIPLNAVAQEVVGNRVIYGNFTQDYDIDTTVKLPFVLKTANKYNTGTYLDYLGLKCNRNYEVGFVFSDDYGRTTPVMFGQNKSIYIDGNVQSNYTKQLAFEWDLSNLGYVQTLREKGFKYYSVVVKQSEQEYYNVYTPGFGYYNGKTYFSVFSDNINKIPIDTSNYNTETNINTTNTKTFLSVENNSYSETSTSSTNTQIRETAIRYTYENNNFTGGDSISISGFTNIVGYSTVGHEYNTVVNGIKPFPDGTTSTFTINNGVIPDGENPVVDVNGDFTGTYFSTGFVADNCTGVAVYVDGVLQSGSQYSFNKDNATISFSSNSIPSSEQTIVVFFKYDNFLLPADSIRSAVSFTEITGSAVITTGENYQVSVTDETYSTSSTSTYVGLIGFISGDLEPVKITGISTLSNFNNISQDVLDASEDLIGIYKKDNNYIVAEIDGEYGRLLYSENSEFQQKYADLGILETEGFESSIDIYYETATQGTVPSFSGSGTGIYRINYYNCINLRTPARFGSPSITWQESRIKGGFNENSMDYGVQAFLTNKDYGAVNRVSSIIYSGVLNNRTKVNNTNQFPSGEDIIRTLDPSFGSIQKLYADTDDLIILQEEKVSKALIDKDIIYTAEGQGLTAAGAKVISQINSYATNYGIGKNPESFAVFANRKYFVDKPKGAVLRLSNDGITEISSYGMRSYFRDKLSANTTEIVGAWDMYNKEYVLSIQGDENITLGFDESNNGWVSRYSYYPERGGSLNGSFYTFQNGELYKHNANSLYNNFYGQQSEEGSFVDIVFNQNPSANKNFLTINYEGSNTWNISNIDTDSDSAQDIIAYNAANDDLIISGFKKYDNKYHANIINSASAVNENEVVPGDNMSGIKGFFAKLKIKTDATDYKELFSVSTNYNINSY